MVPATDPQPELDAPAAPLPLGMLNVLFFASGVAALVYEVSWNRQLGLLFGHTTHASATVLAAYFAGMAIGYGVGGRLVRRISPLRGYAICEFLVAVWACLIPSLLNIVESTALSGLLQHPAPNLQLAARVLFCVFLLLPATAALGATLPMMADALVQQADETRSKLTLAYACNTLGALIGALIASSVLLVSVGVSRSAYLAAILSTLCGAIAWRLAPEVIPHRLKKPPQNTADTIAASPRWSWTLIAALSGFTILALEVLYARLFSLVFHNSTYTFGYVLFVFLLGLSCGSVMIRKLSARHGTQTLLTTICWLASLSISLSVVSFIVMTQLQYFDFGRTFVAYFWGSFGLVLLICFQPAMLLGMLLPLVWIENAQQHGHSAKAIGDLTLVNTIAAAIGAICASFVLIPSVGLWGAFVVMSLLVLLPILWHSTARIPGVLMASVAVIMALPLVISDPENWVRSDNSDVLVRRWNSSYGWIDVVVDPRHGSRKVRQNLHYRFGATGANAQREFRQAHLPLLIHPDPQSAVFLGLGTGMTAAGAIPHEELRKITVVELIPEVVEAVRSLKEDNRNVVDNPRVSVVTDDARHFLNTTDQQFDVIVSDLFVPWESETGYLYTVEHYEVARQRLQAAGVFCQWLPMYQLGPADFEIIADSLRTVFPHVTLWWGNMSARRPMVALIATNQPIVLDNTSIERRIQSMIERDQYDDSAITTATQLYELYAGDWPLRERTRLNTDEHPWVEFHAPISHQSRRLLQGGLLKQYYDRTLNSLKYENVRLKGHADEEPAPGNRWHRTVLFPES